MASVALQDVLGAPQLCGVIQETTTGIPDVFPANFWEDGATVDKDTGSYIRVQGQRQNSKISKYGSPAERRELQNAEDVPFICIHTIEKIELPAAQFRGLIRKDSAGSNLVIDQKGADEIARQIKQARTAVDNLRTSAKTSAFFQGAIWWNNKGQLLANATGAVTTAAFGIPAGNQNQLNVFGTGNIISAPWSIASTPIEQQVITIKQASARQSGYPLKYAFYGKNIPSYLVQNNTLQQFFVRNGNANPQYLATGDIPNPLLGLTWVPAYEAFFNDVNGNPLSVVGDDQVIFTPDPTDDWHEVVQGKYDIPGDAMLGSTGMDLLAGLETVEGMFMYATLQTDPVRITLIFGDTFLPVIKNPICLYQANTVF
jgi:hypothetical protein